MIKRLFAGVGEVKREACNRVYAALYARKGEGYAEDLRNTIERSQALEKLVESSGWQIIRDRINERTKAFFEHWSEGDDSKDTRARAHELQSLLKWVSKEIAAGAEAGQQLETLEKIKRGG